MYKLITDNVLQITLRDLTGMSLASKQINPHIRLVHIFQFCFRGHHLTPKVIKVVGTNSFVKQSYEGNICKKSNN